ncbi:hypothetical protein E2C01_000923 [Portunus trituberculatus]|uniref:Uncharacterized protein n=1 Tax=Portunus trituberculatus TaxID=210409 RepID=A0A5B7CGB8_PORTR|nr:hypothetical protein [Portunus trituberculatus]
MVSLLEGVTRGAPGVWMAGLSRCWSIRTARPSLPTSGMPALPVPTLLQHPFYLLPLQYAHALVHARRDARKGSTVATSLLGFCRARLTCVHLEPRYRAPSRAPSTQATFSSRMGKQDSSRAVFTPSRTANTRLGMKGFPQVHCLEVSCLP